MGPPGDSSPGHRQRRGSRSCTAVSRNLSRNDDTERLAFACRRPPTPARENRDPATRGCGEGGQPAGHSETGVPGTRPSLLPGHRVGRSRPEQLEALTRKVSLRLEQSALGDWSLLPESSSSSLFQNKNVGQNYNAVPNPRPGPVSQATVATPSAGPGVRGCMGRGEGISSALQGSGPDLGVLTAATGRSKAPRALRSRSPAGLTLGSAGHPVGPGCVMP